MNWELVVSVIGLLIGAFAFVQWWSGEATRVRQAVRDAAPGIYFHVGSDNNGYTITVQNRGTTPAFDGAAYLPGIDGAAWQIDEIPAGMPRVFNVPLANDSPPRTTRMPNAEVTFACKDRLGLEYRQVFALNQTPRDDGRFNFGTPDAGRRTKPHVGWREVWRLRRQA